MEQCIFTDERFELFQGREPLLIRAIGVFGEIGIRLSGEQILDSKNVVFVK